MGTAMLFLVGALSFWAADAAAAIPGGPAAPLAAGGGGGAQCAGGVCAGLRSEVLEEGAGGGGNFSLLQHGRAQHYPPGPRTGQCGPAAASPAVPALPFNAGYAKQAAMYSSVAYCVSADLQAWPSNFKGECAALNPNAAPPRIFGGRYMQRAVMTVDPALEAVVVSFMGMTESIFNLMTEFPIEGVICPVRGKILPGRYHQFFCMYYQDLAARGFAEALEREVGSNPGLDLLFTGHSMGGAAATIAAADAAYRLPVRPRRILLYTFGQPRVGNAAAAAYINSHVDVAYRVTQHRDPSPLLPLCRSQCLPAAPSGCPCKAACDASDPFLAYHHGREVHFKGDGTGEFTLCNDSGEDFECSDGLVLTVPGTRFDQYTFLGMNLSSACCSPPPRPALG